MRVLGIDHGAARIGVAVSDPTGTIASPHAVLEEKDKGAQVRRVAELARALAKEMGLSEWQIMGIHIAGLLHDVGKVAVPSEILSKPGKISQYEFSIIKNHCQVGCEILQKIDFPWPVTQAILQHHERLNGSGYPEGLSGEDIIIEQRSDSELKSYNRCIFMRDEVPVKNPAFDVTPGKYVKGYITEEGIKTN